MADGTRQIPMSTTDAIPEAAGRPVRASRLGWASSQMSVLEAQDQLADWAARNGYDAVVGVRLVAYPGVRVTDWVMYGTAISWQD